MPRKRKPLEYDPGLLARTMLAARHKAGLNAAKCAELCGLSTSFLHLIEKGRRTPTLSRIPAIAAAYKTDPTELCWTWLLANAPEAIRYLAMTASYDNSDVLQAAARQRYVDELAQKAEHAAAQKARVQAARAAAKQSQDGWGEPVGGASPDGPDFELVAYRQTSELDPAQSLMTPRGAVVDPAEAVKRK
jgi:transcriptional regulator with XRE-family HTH domain